MSVPWTGPRILYWGLGRDGSKGISTITYQVEQWVLRTDWNLVEMVTLQCKGAIWGLGEFASVSEKAVSKFSTVVLSFSQNHGTKHAKVLGTFSLAWTGASPFTVLQRWKFRLVEKMLQLHRATLLSGQCLSRTTLTSCKQCNSKLLLCLQGQNHTKMAEKYTMQTRF